jgi:hypothetical protein
LIEVEFSYFIFDCEWFLLAPQNYIDIDYPRVIFNPNLSSGIDPYNDLTKISKEELQSEFNKLGYEYDFKTHTANKKRWRAKLGEYYFGIAEAIELVKYREDNDSFDNKNYKIGNYFQTQAIAQKACDLFSESLKEFNSNLK